jgi:hypothetical protein
MPQQEGGLLCLHESRLVLRRRGGQGIPEGCAVATAVSELLYFEATLPSGLFLQEKATLYDSGNGYINSETALAQDAVHRALGRTMNEILGNLRKVEA